MVQWNPLSAERIPQKKLFKCRRLLLQLISMRISCTLFGTKETSWSFILHSNEHSQLSLSNTKVFTSFSKNLEHTKVVFRPAEYGVDRIISNSMHFTQEKFKANYSPAFYAARLSGPLAVSISTKVPHDL